VEHKPEEQAKTVKLIILLIVAFPNTGAKPNAVMVEFQDAVVAHVAMACPWRSKNHASFTKFELEKLGAVNLANLLVRDFR